MFSASWVFGLWGDALREQLLNGFFEGAISFDKDTLYLRFTRFDGSRYTLEVKFIDGHMFILTSDRIFDQNDLRKGMSQFKEIENLQIVGIKNDPNDRWICIQLLNNNELWLKGFGKFGNVLLRNSISDETISLFRLSLKSDWEFKYPLLEVIQSSDSDVKKPNPDELSALHIKNWPLSVEELVQAELHFMRDFYFDRNKMQLIDGLEKKIKHYKKIIVESQRRLKDIETRRSNKELGDLILAHSHSLKPGLTKALVTDYFTDQRIWIKLNPDLSAADNAKKYYGKAKNEVIEVKKLLEQIETTQTNLKDLELQHAGACASTDFKSLKSFQRLAPPVSNQIQDTLPYRLVEFQGYQIWVGKNNKSNDQMLKLAQKNDMWLHAKDVAGSHVIIKKKGAIYPDSVIQHAAQLAAKNSKAKTQSVVPVITVLRKFVSKPKNAAPGEVSVQKEEIVDAFIA